jgi:hypothetical protein
LRTRALAPARGGIVELQIRLSDLRRLAARPARLGAWTTVIADLARQADAHGRARPDRHRKPSPDTGRPNNRHSNKPGPDHDDERSGRSPGRAMRRRTQIRDRTCIHPGCRAPAARTDGDHTQDWADGGATDADNLGSLCRHDHRVKHEGGWQIAQPAPGYFVWVKPCS